MPAYQLTWKYSLVYAGVDVSVRTLKSIAMKRTSVLEDDDEHLVAISSSWSTAHCRTLRSHDPSTSEMTSCWNWASCQSNALVSSDSYNILQVLTLYNKCY